MNNTTDLLESNFAVIYDICRAACNGDAALGKTSVKKLARMIDRLMPDDAALLKRLTKNPPKNPEHFVQK